MGLGIRINEVYVWVLVFICVKIIVVGMGLIKVGECGG